MLSPIIRDISFGVSSYVVVSMQKKYHKAWKNVKKLALNSNYDEFGDKNRNIKDVLLVEQLVNKEIPKKPRYARTIYIELFEDCKRIRMSKLW